MSSRTLASLSLAAFLAASLSIAACASAAAPADSLAAAAPADSTSDVKHDVEKAKDEAKDAIKDEAKQKENETEAAKKEHKKAEAAAKKAAAAAKKAAKKAGKTNAKAPEAEKGAVTQMESAEAAPGTMPVKPATPPQHVQVQHILIGFTGSIPGKTIMRSKEDAKALAYMILARARKGEDFDALVKQYTDDSPPGIYGMSASGVPAGPGEYSRDGMVPAFGNVGFNISPGNIGIADYDAQESPYGWHIIKRLK